MDYYVYLYLREDGTPYYVGKGRGDRYKAPHRRGHTCVPVPPADRVVFHAKDLTEDTALEMEYQLIQQYGLKDEGGLLINILHTKDGKVVFTEDAKERMSQAAKKRGAHSKETYDKVAEALRGKARPDEVRKKISKAHKGKKLSPEAKEKLRQEQERRKREDPEYYEKMKERARKGAEARWGKKKGLDNK